MRVGDRLVALNGAEIGEAAGASLGEMLSAAGWWGAQGAEHGRGARVALLVLRAEAGRGEAGRGEACRDATPSPAGPSPPDAARSGTGGRQAGREGGREAGSGSDGGSSDRGG